MKEINVEIVVLGSGPGGYTAAFRAADLLQEPEKVALIERYDSLGGVCLNVGCIPSKALLNVAETIRYAQHLEGKGVEWGPPKFNIDHLRDHKNKVIKQLTTGLDFLASSRKILSLKGTAKFLTPFSLELIQNDERKIINFKKAIIAVGSRVVKLPFLPTHPRIVDSTGALELPFIPQRMLIIGGGIIGLEMASIYSALGSKITIVEMGAQLIPAADADIVSPLLKFAKKNYEQILFNTKVSKAIPDADGVDIYFNDSKEPERFDLVLAAVGRIPNADQIQIEKANIELTEKGFIKVNNECQTNQTHIYAIGDCVGQPMLAHKAIPEGKVAAENSCGHKSIFAPRCIPSVAYTDPEVAWVGATEKELIQGKVAYEKAIFPWAASGRALAMGSQDGLTKILFHPENHHILGAGICGPHAGDLISEVALAIEMGCVAEDLALTIHPHPTLSETIAQACEAFEGTITDLMPTKRK